MVAQSRRDTIQRSITASRGKVNIQGLLKLLGVWGDDGLCHIAHNLRTMADHDGWAVTNKAVDRGLKEYDDWIHGPKVLKRCPFCGGKAHFFKWQSGGSWDSPIGAHTGCGTCGVSYEGDHRESGEKWNKRVKAKA